MSHVHRGLSSPIRPSFPPSLPPSYQIPVPTASLPEQTTGAILQNASSTHIVSTAGNEGGREGRNEGGREGGRKGGSFWIVLHERQEEGWQERRRKQRRKSGISDLVPILYPSLPLYVYLYLGDKTNNGTHEISTSCIVTIVQLPDANIAGANGTPLPPSLPPSLLSCACRPI